MFKFPHRRIYLLRPELLSTKYVAGKCPQQLKFQMKVNWKKKTTKINLQYHSCMYKQTVFWDSFLVCFWSTEDIPVIFVQGNDPISYAIMVFFSLDHINNDKMSGKNRSYKIVFVPRKVCLWFLLISLLSQCN